MKTYNITITECFMKEFEQEANSYSEARKIIMDKYYDNDITMDDAECFDNEVF